MIWMTNVLPNGHYGKAIPGCECFEWKTFFQMGGLPRRFTCSGKRHRKVQQVIRRMRRTSEQTKSQTAHWPYKVIDDWCKKACQKIQPKYGQIAQGMLPISLANGIIFNKCQPTWSPKLVRTWSQHGPKIIGKSTKTQPRITQKCSKMEPKWSPRGSQEAS